MSRHQPHFIASLFHDAAKGLTRDESRQKHGVSYHCVAAAANTYRIPFKHGKEAAQLKRPRSRTPIGRIKAAGILDQMTMREKSDSPIFMRKGEMNEIEALEAVGRHDLAEFFKQKVTP